MMTVVSCLLVVLVELALSEMRSRFLFPTTTRPSHDRSSKATRDPVQVCKSYVVRARAEGSSAPRRSRPSKTMPSSSLQMTILRLAVWHILTDPRNRGRGRGTQTLETRFRGPDVVSD